MTRQFESDRRLKNVGIAKLVNAPLWYGGDYKFESYYQHQKYLHVEESGLSRRIWDAKHAGSNPAMKTKEKVLVRVQPGRLTAVGSISG